MSPWSVIVYTVAAAVFFGVGYVIGNQQGDDATYRNCAYGGRSELVTGGSIKCSIERRGEEPLPNPLDSRPKPDKPRVPPIGFEKTDQG